MTDKLLDFNAKRQETIEKKRRNFERLMFKEVMGAYSVLDETGAIYPVALVDISHQGCLFQIPLSKNSEKRFEKGTEMTLRMYFTRGSYIPVVVKIRYTKEHIEDGQAYMRYGTEFDTTVPTFEALKSFIDFLYKFAEHSTVDKGDAKVFFI